MCNVCKTVQIAPKLKLLQTLGLLIELVSINHQGLMPLKDMQILLVFCFYHICLFDINGRYFALILFFSKCYVFSFLSLLFQRGAEIYSYFYFSEGQNFIGLISTADLGRWQLSDPPSTFHTEQPTQKDFPKNHLCERKQKVSCDSINKTKIYHKILKFNDLPSLKEQNHAHIQKCNIYQKKMEM